MGYTSRNSHTKHTRQPFHSWPSQERIYSKRLKLLRSYRIRIHFKFEWNTQSCYLTVLWNDNILTITLNETIVASHSFWDSTLINLESTPRLKHVGVMDELTKRRSWKIVRRLDMFNAKLNQALRICVTATNSRGTNPVAR